MKSPPGTNVNVSGLVVSWISSDAEPSSGGVPKNPLSPGAMANVSMKCAFRTPVAGLKARVADAIEPVASVTSSGPHLKKPYEPQQVVDWIKKLRNLRRSP